MKTLSGIQEELLEGDETLAELLEMLTLVTTTESNNIKSVSVMPLPNVVKDKATELKERFTKIALDEDKGLVSVINTRIAILNAIIDYLDTNKADLDNENQEITANLINAKQLSIDNDTYYLFVSNYIQGKITKLQLWDSNDNVLKFENGIMSINGITLTKKTYVDNLANTKVNKTDIVDNLTTNDATKVLSAKQGKALNDNKVDKTAIYNGLDKADSGYALDARQGKALNETKVSKTTKVNGHALSGDVTVTKSDVGLGNVDNTSDLNKPISNATQSALDLKVAFTDVINALTSTTTNKPLSAYQGKLLKDMIDTINTLLASNDTDLDTIQEVVTYIKSNKSLIDTLSTNKVNVSDIIDNLTSEISNKPLSAKQGYVLKGLIDAFIPITNSEIDALFTGGNS